MVWAYSAFLREEASVSPLYELVKCPRSDCLGLIIPSLADRKDKQIYPVTQELVVRCPECNERFTFKPSALKPVDVPEGRLNDLYPGWRTRERWG